MKLKNIFISNYPIIALSTSLGYSGINIIRISGNNLDIILKNICNKSIKFLIPRYATYTNFKKKNGDLIDNGIVIYFKSPYSYTGEDILEFHIHGGIIVPKILLYSCLEIGKSINLKIAKPGEFTKRALLNNKINLDQVEAIINLIKSNNKYNANFAANLFSGKFSNLINIIEKKIKKLFLLIETEIDFSEENLKKIKKKNIKIKLKFIKNKINNLLNKFSKYSYLNNIIKIIIIGKSNVGKSSLFNLLTKSQSSIITPIPGTTRDIIKKKVKINNISYNIIDSAGIRKINKINKIEKIGIDKTWKEIKKIDIILYILDIKSGFTLEDKKNIKFLPKNIPKIFIWNKIDILKNYSYLIKKKNKKFIYISSYKNIGIKILKKKINKLTYNFENKFKNNYYFYTKRLFLLKFIKKKIKNLIINNKYNTLDILSEELRCIYKKFNHFNKKKINFLNEIFSNFCIGK